MASQEALSSMELVISLKDPVYEIWLHGCELGYRRDVSYFQITVLKKLRGLSPQANYTNRATAAVGEVVPTFAGRGCYVVSAADSHGR
jgi:hypothetical protein